MFKNEELKALDASIEQALKNKQQELDELSHEIRILEQRLKLISLPNVFSLIIKSEIDSSYQGYDDAIAKNEESITWGKDSTKNFRIMYSKMNTVYNLNGDKVYSKLYYTKPLMECVIYIRLLCKPYLADFYKEIIKQAGL